MGPHPPLPRSSHSAARRRSAAWFVVVCSAFLAVGGRAASAQDDAERAKLERAVQSVWLETEPDHARVRASGLDAEAASLAVPLVKALSQTGAWPAAGAERIAALRSLVSRARTGTTWVVSTTTTAIALDRAFPGALPADAATEAGLAKALTAALRALLAKPRFADCWDDAYLGVPEVRAWTAFGARTETPPKPPVKEGPTDATPKAPGTDVPVVPGPQNPEPPAVDPATLLVIVEKADAFTGPWTGWIDDIKEKDNKRAKRSGAKTVWIDRYEVTRAEYARFLASLDSIRRRQFLPLGWTTNDAGDAVAPEGPADLPVTGVTYVQAAEYAASQGKRLPTEDEWERAAGGGKKDARVFPWGESAAGKSWAFLGTDPKGPVAVTSYPDDATPDGVVGMAGNVAEIVATQPDRKDVPAKIPEGPFVIVLRGGSYRSRESDCQTGARWKIDARAAESHVGFRCVMDDAEYRRRFSK